MKNKVLLIGASGFVGTRLIDTINGKYEIRNIDKQESLFFPENTIIGDIRHPSDLTGQMKGVDTVVLLAAEHRDDVSPTSLYYDVNVEGTKNVLKEMNKAGINNIIFTSTVAVYGLNKDNPNENHAVDPFNHYGKSKWQAEVVLREWYEQQPNERSLIIVRPTVIFGERNRGNVFNLLEQIASGKFMMVGKGANLKSMAYVGNIVSFLKYCIENTSPGYTVYNYVDKPDLNMNQLVEQVEKSLNKKIPSFRIPYSLGLICGYVFDTLSYLSGKSFSISSVRVKKFCATTQFDACKAHSSGFEAPYSLFEGLDNTLQYEFINESKDDITFESE